MINRLDHVVILVRDLDAAIRDYRQLGFHVVPGGEHTGGASHNALVSFADGSYLELIAFKREAPDHIWWRHVARGEGLIDFALLPSVIGDDIDAARGRGLDLDGPFPGGRLRPDGQRLEWETGRAHTPDLPFLCADVTPRALRVPAGEAHQHPNGAQGVAMLELAVADLAASLARYRALLGREPESGTTAFVLGKTRLQLAEIARIPAAPGEGPVALTLTTTRPGEPVTLDAALTHGVPITLVTLVPQ
jgi:catechol 2,3-dioxygenase-like lactoylglutathione lyase family enzyme